MDSDHTTLVLGEKTFLPSDQEVFARLSADFNPLHMDAVAARRLITGRQVVHGIHVMLCALEFWRPGHDVGCFLECQFSNAVSVGDKVTFFHALDDGGNDVLSAQVGDMTCAHITLSSTPSCIPKPGFPTSVPAPMEFDGEIPLNLPPQEQMGQSYCLTWQDKRYRQAFPNACRLMGTVGVAAAAAASRFVGMVCPGLHSVFTSFRCQGLPVETGDKLEFFVRRFDPRFQSFDIVFRGALEGGIRAFRRPPPQAQVASDQILGVVGENEFSGRRALVIGGSRGLGELVAKILAAGNAEVTISYASGEQDASAIRDEIGASGRGKCNITNVNLSEEPNWAEVFACQPDTVYYFATPRIFIKKASIFDPLLFEEFSLFYLRRFLEMCQYLEEHGTGSKRTVYLPSTVYVENRPKGLVEYAMAKAASEVLADEINANFTQVSVLASRLPKLNTDQTASIFEQIGTSNLDVLLPLVRRVQEN